MTLLDWRILRAIVETFAVIALLFFMSCGQSEYTNPTMDCGTVCGIRLDARAPKHWVSGYDEPGSIDCSFVQTTERMLLGGAWRHWEGPAKKYLQEFSFCDRIRGLKIYVAPGDKNAFEYTYGNEKRVASGVTFCHLGYSVVANVPMRFNAMAHEMVHAVSACNPIADCKDFENPDCDHFEWDKMGISESIAEAMGR